jgi:hypothetical protein
MKRRWWVGGIVVLLLAGIYFMQPSKESLPLRFENYEGFLGLGVPDEAAALRDFQQLFPAGTKLDEIEAYFQKIGGDCLELPLDRPYTLWCGYEHPRYWLPFIPMANTWAVGIKYEGDPRVSTEIKVTAGIDGP